MTQISYGRNKQLIFSNIEEEIKTVGFLANPQHAHITHEFNQKNGSYSDADRIKIISNPTIVQHHLTGLYDALRSQNRINCNSFIEKLLNHYGFIQNETYITADKEFVKSKISVEYHNIFDEGYNL